MWFFLSTRGRHSLKTEFARNFKRKQKHHWMRSRSLLAKCSNCNLSQKLVFSKLTSMENLRGLSSENLQTSSGLFFHVERRFSAFFVKIAFYVSRETSGGILEETKFIFFRSVGNNCSASFSKLPFMDPERHFGKKFTSKVYLFLSFLGLWGKIFQVSCQICVLRVQRGIFCAIFFSIFGLRGQNWQLTGDKNLHGEGLLLLS